jgi:beta-glucosidase-like glycosyl hydrolase
MAKAYVRGLQNGDGSMDGAGYHLAQANTKHFIGYQGASTRGLYSPTEVYLSTRDMIDTFEPGWRGALEANSAGVMCAYSTLCDDDTNTTCFQRYGLSHGIPMCAHPEMLNGWLRASGGEGAAPGWNGTVVGDCGAIKFLETDHRWAVNQSDAAAKALHAGTDLDCTIEPGTGFAALLNATREGLTTPHAIDAALGRFLTNQLKLGLYDPPEMNPWRAIPMGLVNGPAHRGLAAQAARESLVLLANAGGVLPLRAGAFTAPGSLLVTGPNAQLIASGNYNAQTDVNVTAWMGLARALPPGAALLAPGCQCVACPSTSLFPAALAAAGGAGAIVAVMGLDASQEYEDSTRASLALPGVQEELLLALCAAAAPRGTPVVLVLMGGSAVAPSPVALGAVSAVVWAGYAGEEAGTALAEAIFGLYSPGGRMPFTTYSNASDLPPYYNMSLQGAPFGRTYRYFTGPPVTFRFGAGLSYTRFSYTPLALGVPVAASQSAPPAPAPLQPCQALNVTLTVQNSGAWDGDEVVQCYVRLVGVGGGATPASATPQVVLPRLSLAAFSRVSLPAASPPMAVSFSLGPRSLAIVNATALGWQQVPCTVQVFVGSQQPTDEDWDSAQALSVPLSGPPTLVSTCPSQ